MTLEKIITIKEIFNQIKSLKNTFIIIIILSILSSLYLIFSNESKWKASIELRTLDSHLTSEYKHMEAINNSVIRSIDNLEKNILALKEEDEVGFFSQVNNLEIHDEEEGRLFLLDYNDQLLLILTDETSRKDVIVDALDKISLLNKSDFKSLDHYYSQLEYQAVNFKTLPPIVTPESKQIFKRDYYPNWRITFISEDKEKSIDAITKVLETANKNVQEFLISNFEEYLEVIQIPYQEKITTLEVRKALLINQYDMSRENNIAYLKEQAAIARSLGYDKSVVGSQNITINIPLSISSLRESEGDDYYLRGYEVIETQIELLNNRDNDFKKYIPELIQTESLIIAINEHRDVTMKKLEDTFKSTPIFKDNFLSALYDRAEINVDRIGVSNFEIIILSILVTLILCIFVFIISFISNVVKKEINN